MGKMLAFLRDLWSIRITIVIIITPLVLLPLIFVSGTQEAKCGYVLIVMSVYWITEALPLAVTGLIPVVGFPLLGVMTGTKISNYYIQDASMFGMGGFVVAIAIQKCNLHKRLSLAVMLLFGTDPKWLMMGFMLVTWFLSMWISNTATTAMLIPIVGAVLEQLRIFTYSPSKPGAGVTEIDNVAFEMEDNTGPSESETTTKEKRKDSYDVTKDENENSEEDLSAMNEEYKLLCKGMSLCIAYAANIGGTATLSGTTPNIVLQGQADALFRRVGLESGINFASWMMLALPGSALCLVVAWFWLVFLFLGWRTFFRCGRFTEGSAAVKDAIRKEYRSLGPITFAEGLVSLHFIVLIVLWLSRSPPEAEGWGSAFLKGYVGDSVAAILITISLFICPSRLPRIFCCRKGGDTSSKEPTPALLDWDFTEKHMPWGLILLIGGGFALAGASFESGLSHWIGEQMLVFSDLEPSVMVLVLCIVIALATEVTSNTATITLTLPILAKMAEALQLNPLFLMCPVTLAVSFAFMLPVATPPNALVFATGHLEVKDMIKAGAMMNILCIAVLQLAVNTWGPAVFKWDVLPDEFKKNVTGTI